MTGQAKVYCGALMFTMAAAYVGGVAFSATCEQGCKSIGAYAQTGGGGCVAFRDGSCYSDSVWVDGVETGPYGSTKCSTAHSSGDVITYSCKNCTEVCSNTGGTDLREMSKPNPHQSTDCSYSGKVKRKACGPK
jgi:hypothetical protein